VQGGVTLTYEELFTFAGQIAYVIQQVISRPCPRVLLAIPQSAAAYAGMIGTLGVGGTFCPLNLQGPSVRNSTIATEFSPDVVLFEGSPPSFLDELPATTPQIDVSKVESHTLTERITESSEIAYVVFTSGSSGQPKGVKIGRTAFSHFLTVARNCFDLKPGERWGQYSNLGYDMAIMDVFLAVTGGATLVPLASRKEQLMPATAIKDQQIAIWQSVPSALELMIRANQVSKDYLESLRLISFCGEPLLARQLEKLFRARPDIQVFNTYGTTETTGFNTINRLNAENYRDSCETSTVALGANVPGWKLTLRGGQSTDEGEIVVSSDFLSLGYWRDEERTRDTFRLSIADETGPHRSYLTGDWAIRLNSRLYFSSRIDRQVKIRGERIELNEIDACLREEGFLASYTVFVADELHSFVESVSDVDQERVRSLLGKRLPFHAVPKTIRALPSLPRNANGKIDRETLTQLVAS
jgi:D-alanine--poly(phosphoribitol) ligase subunit 1